MWSISSKLDWATASIGTKGNVLEPDESRHFPGNLVFTAFHTVGESWHWTLQWWCASISTVSFVFQNNHHHVCRWNGHDLLWRKSRGEFPLHHISRSLFLFLSDSKWWSRHISWGKKSSMKPARSALINVRFYREGIGFVCFRLRVIRHGTHRAEINYISISLCIMCSILSRDVLISLAIWCIVNHLSSKSMCRTRSMFSIIVDRNQ